MWELSPARGIEMRGDKSFGGVDDFVLGFRAEHSGGGLSTVDEQDELS